MIRNLNKIVGDKRGGLLSLIISDSFPRYKNTIMSSSSCEKNMKEGESLLVAPREEIIRYISDCMVKVGASREDGITIAEHLFVADYRGHFSHGMNRVEMYVKDVENGLTSPNSRPKILNDFKAIGLVDGNNGFGQVIGKFCMNLAISKAKEFGIGMISCRGSNHYGIAGYYSLLAIRENLIGFSCTNTSPLMAPTRSRVPGLGTNPISVGARTTGENGGDEFVLDMATTCVALGKIELAVRKGESIPKGWALGEDGRPTSDGQMAVKNACLMPLGGEEANSGYKGYGLALMVELLCGVLSGSNFGPNIRRWNNADEVANLGHCFMAIDPDKFGPGAGERLDILLKQIRGLPRVEEDSPVLIPGDPERIHMKEVDQLGGIFYHENQIEASKNLAIRLGVEPMKLLNAETK